LGKINNIEHHVRFIINFAIELIVELIVKFYIQSIMRKNKNRVALDELNYFLQPRSYDAKFIKFLKQPHRERFLNACVIFTISLRKWHTLKDLDV